MLYQPAASAAEYDFTIVVHRDLPCDWPSVRAMDIASCFVFQTHEYLTVWQRTRGRASGAQCYFVEVRDSLDRRMLLLPMAIIRRWGARTLTFIDGSLSDFNAPVIYPNAVNWTPQLVTALWTRILEALPAVDVVALEKMPAHVHGAVNPLVLMSTQACPEGGHGSNLTLTWEGIEATQRRLKRWKPSQRQLEKIGDLRMVMAQTAEERATILARLLAQKQRRMNETKVNGFDRDPAKLAYFHQATEVFAGIDCLHLCALKVGDEIVATSWNIVHGKTVSAIMIGFEAGEWARYSCGRILNLMYMRWLKEHGFTYLDQGFGDESWKLESCDTHVQLMDHEVSHTLRGRLALTVRDLRMRLRANPRWQAVRRALFRPRQSKPDLSPPPVT